MNNTSNTDIFYFGLLQWDILKTLTVVVNLAVVSAGLPLLYFMIWYEHNSGDLMYRTLINQLLSYLCIIEIVGCLLTRIIYFLIYFCSPLPMAFCNGAIFIGRLIFSLLLTQVTMRQFLKYLYIFKWKYIVGLNDDFFALFLTISNVLLSALFVTAAYQLGFHNEETGN